jgi:hypothetical protein
MGGHAWRAQVGGDLSSLRFMGHGVFLLCRDYSNLVRHG